MPRPDPPDQEYLVELSNDIPPLWEGRNQRINEVRTERKHLRGAQGPSEITQLTKLPAPQSHAIEDLIRHTQGLFAKNLPLCTRDPLDPNSAGDRQNAEAVARWLNGSYRITLDSPANVYFQATDAFPQDGQAVIKDTLLEHRFRIRRGKGEDDKVYLDRVARHRRDPSNFPFISEHIDTTFWFPVRDDFGAEGPGIHAEVMEVTERERAPFFQQYKKQIEKAYELGRVINPQFGSSSLPTCKVTEWWSRWYWALLADDVLIDSGPHGYGRVPYFAADFSTTSLKDRAHLTEGLADPLVSVQRQLESIDLLFQAWAHFSALPRFRMRPINYEDIQPIPTNFEVKLAPFSIVMGPPGWYIEQLSLADIGDSLMRWRAAVLQEKDELSLAPILLGKSETTQPGTSMVGTLEVANSVLTVAHGNLRGTFNDLARHRLHCVDKILREPVPLEYYDPADKGKKRKQWIEIGPDEIQGNYMVDHEVQAVTDAEKALKGQLAMTKYNNGLISKRQALVEMGEAEPDRKLEERYVEDFLNAGPTQQKIIGSAFELHAALVGEVLGDLAGEGTPEANPAGMSGPFVPQLEGQGQQPGVMDMPRPPGAIGENPAAGLGPPPGMPPEGMPLPVLGP